MSSHPAPSSSEFDHQLRPLSAALKRWWRQESTDFDSAIRAGSGAGIVPVWNRMPEIDSKAIVKASPIFEQYLGLQLPPSMIKRGGYDSFEQLWDDLIPKLRELFTKQPLAGRSYAGR
jgi:hypothetical protein